MLFDAALYASSELQEDVHAKLKLTHKLLIHL